MKNTMKKLLSLLLVLTMTVGIAPLSGVFTVEVEAEELTEGFYTYVVTDGKATITGCNSYYAIGDLVIPSTLGDYPVTSIGNSAFYYCWELTSVTIPDGVESIGGEVFENCIKLTSVTIPDSVTSIGDSSFYDASLNDVYYTGDIESWCGIEFGSEAANPMYRAENFYINNTLVKKIVIPDTVTEIKDYTFYGFDGITSVTIDGVESIGAAAFGECINLTSVIIPDSVTSIGGRAFEGCTRLKSVTIFDSVENIGYRAFDGCTRLADVYYKGTEKEWNEIIIDLYNDPLLDATIHFTDEICEHAYKFTVISPTCTEQGYTTCTCLYCGEIYIMGYTDALGHIWGDWVVTLEPTTTSSGMKTRYCETCKTAYQEQIIPPLPDEYSLSGSVTSFDSETDEIHITITKKGETEPAYSQSVTGTKTEYMFENVATGYYTITVTKKNHVTRTYDIAIGNINETLDIKLHLPGDTIGDGKINTVDVAIVNSHAKGVKTLEGYQFACADVNGDGKINTIDVAKINAHAKGVSLLW